MKRCRWLAVLMLVMMVALVGCGKKPVEEVENVASDLGFCLYYINMNETGLVPVSYELDSSYNEEDAAIEILSQLSQVDDKHKESCKPSINEAMEARFQSYSDGIITIDLTGGFRELPEATKLLCKASIVYTLCQIETIEKVSLTVEGVKVMEYDSDVGLGESNLTREDFCLGLDSVYHNSVNVTLFLSNHKGTKLKEHITEVKVDGNETLEYAIVRTLRDFKETEEFRPTLPADLAILSVQVYGDTCYVDLDAKINEPIRDMSKDVCIHSIVESLLALERVNKVQMLMNGELVDSLTDYENYNQIYMSDYGFTKGE